MCRRIFRTSARFSRRRRRSLEALLARNPILASLSFSGCLCCSVFFCSTRAFTFCLAHVCVRACTRLGAPCRRCLRAYVSEEARACTSSGAFKHKAARARLFCCGFPADQERGMRAATPFQPNVSLARRRGSIFRRATHATRAAAALIGTRGPGRPQPPSCKRGGQRSRTQAQAQDQRTQRQTHRIAPAARCPRLTAHHPTLPARPPLTLPTA